MMTDSITSFINQCAAACRVVCAHGVHSCLWCSRQRALNSDTQQETVTGVLIFLSTTVMSGLLSGH